jgi:hypothetical protein
LSSKPRAIPQHFEMNALSENDRAFRAAKIAETAFVGKICRSEGRRRDAMTPITCARSIRTIQINSDHRHALQWRTSHLIFRVDVKVGRCPRNAADGSNKRVLEER